MGGNMFAVKAKICTYLDTMRSMLGYKVSFAILYSDF